MIYRGMDQQELERQYDARGTVSDITPFLDQYAALTRKAKEHCEVKADIRYGDHPDETYDYFLAGPGAPVFVFVHGGYWRALTKDESGFMAPCFVEAGISVVSVNYSLAPEASLNQIVDQVQRAVAHVVNNADDMTINPKRIYLCGTSAGGHLAAMVLNDARETARGPLHQSIAGACLISGLYDLEPVRLCLPNSWLNLTAEDAARNSPVHHPPASDCPIQIVWSQIDTDEFRRQSRDFASLLRKVGHTVTEDEVTDRNHFDIILDLADRNRALTRNIFAMIQGEAEQETL